jgi:pseudaminic acid synthase
MKINNHNLHHAVYIIAELSANHNNDVQLALNTIEAMASSGANAVKVQTFTADAMTLDLPSSDFMTRPDSAWAGQKLYDLYSKGALPYDWHPQLKAHANALGLDFFSSPFDLKAVDLLEELEVPAYKIASLEINHIPLIDKVAKTGKPVILSTGVASVEDIDLAVKTIRKYHNDIALLKCTTAYPTLPEESNLLHIQSLISTFGVIGGLSDHSMSPFIPAVAVANGAKIIEKHFILDRKKGGIDSHFSLEPHEFKQMVAGVRETEKALGSKVYELNDKGRNARRSMRSIYVTEDIKAGQSFSDKNIGVIRPGYGLHPKYYYKVLGKTAVIDIKKGTPLKQAHLQTIAQ